MKKGSRLAALSLCLSFLAGACDLSPTPTAIPSPTQVAPAATSTQAVAPVAEATSTATVVATPAPTDAGIMTFQVPSTVTATASITTASSLITSSPEPTRTPDVHVTSSNESVITQSLLVEIDAAQWIPESFAASPDKRHVGYISAVGIRYVMIIDGVKGPEQIGVLENTLVFSPDSKRYAYGVVQPQTQALIIDGKEQKPHGAIEAGLIFSPDSQHVAYGAADFVTATATVVASSPVTATATPYTVKVAKHYVVLDEVEGKQYDGIVKGSIQFSPDSGRLAYVAGGDKNQMVVTKDLAGNKPEQESKVYTSVFSLAFSPDSKRVGFAATVDNKRLVVIDGTEGKQYDGVGTGSPVFSPDSKHAAYLAQTGNHQFIVFDGTEGKQYDKIVGSPVFSPDSKQLAYAAQQNGKIFVVTHDITAGQFATNGKEGKQYDLIGSTMLFSPDSKRLAFVAGNGGKQFVVVDGQDGTPYDGIGKDTLIFSKDSKHVGYIAGVKDGAAAGGNVATPNAAAPLKQFVVIDGQEGKHYDGIGRGTLTFGPDGNHSAYAASVGEKQFLVLDGKEGKQFDVVAKGGIVFTGPSDFYYMSVRNNTDIKVGDVYLLEHYIK